MFLAWIPVTLAHRTRETNNPSMPQMAYVGPAFATTPTTLLSLWVWSSTLLRSLRILDDIWIFRFDHALMLFFQDIFKCELRLDNHLGQSYNASVPPYTIAKLNQYLARFFHAVLRSLGARKNAPTRCIVAILQCIVFSKDIFEF